MGLKSVLAHFNLSQLPWLLKSGLICQVCSLQRLAWQHGVSSKEPNASCSICTSYLNQQCSLEYNDGHGFFFLHVGQCGWTDFLLYSFYDFQFARSDPFIIHFEPSLNLFHRLPKCWEIIHWFLIGESIIIQSDLNFPLIYTCHASIRSLSCTWRTRTQYLSLWGCYWRNP